MTNPTATPQSPGREDTLLEIVHGLTAELHPHKRDGLRVTLDSSLDQDLGLDSLGRVELLLRIEQAFGVRLPEQLLASADRPADLVRALETALPVTPSERKRTVRQPTLDAVEDLPERVETLPGILQWHVDRHPERPSITYYGEADRPEVITYGELLENSRRYAANLQRLGLESGQTVAIMLPTCLEYFYSFMGVILAGGIPVPIYPPARASQIEDHLRRHSTILDNARTRFLITIPEAKIAARLLRMQVLSLRAILSPQDLGTPGEEAPAPSPQGGDIAYLQYTSGSTGHPKGVILTHDNLMANIRACGGGLAADSTDVLVSWLPLYHDMGLIGSWFGTMYYAVPLHLMSPLTFLARPEQWLWTIHQVRGTISGGPNFCYELCLKRISDDKLEGIDLSSWRVAFNGAEPVIPSTMRRFYERFAPYGLREDAMRPIYGLAEVSVGLSFTPPGRPPLVDRVRREPLNRQGRAEPAPQGDENALEFTSCGLPLQGHEVRIVNEAGQELGEREEGRLEFKGPSATSGYYRNPEDTKRLKHGEWTDSGDIAYIAGGEIFLTGRRKDIIIRAGRNIYPHELEDAIGNLEGVRKGCVAVFGSSDPDSGTERLVALAETRESSPEKLKELRREIDSLAVDLLETPLDDVVLAPPHTVPKTSSGKIRRASSRELYERGETSPRPRAVWWQVVRLWFSGLLPQLRRMRQLAGSLAYGVYCISLFGLMVGPVWIAVALVPHPGWNWRVIRGVGRILFGLARIPVRVTGLENLPMDTHLVLAANHHSYLDGLILGMILPRPWSFVAKRELVRSFIARIFLRRLGTEFVERFDMQRGVEDARRVAAAAVNGSSLVFFPEGTFRRTPGLLPFHMGAFQAAVEARAPVLPVTIRGARSILRAGHWVPRHGYITVHVSPLIPPEGEGWNAAIALRDKVRAEMLRHTGEPDLADRPVLL